MCINSSSRRRRRQQQYFCGALACVALWAFPAFLTELARTVNSHGWAYGAFVLREAVSTAPTLVFPAEPAAECTPLLVLKTRRSGSTWLYEMLNKQRRTYIMYELVAGHALSAAAS
eukprot:COSAG02_NODE_36829_length_450_cov_0.584046_1_plen_115_part_10